jgi:hypothetical protein
MNKIKGKFVVTMLLKDIFLPSFLSVHLIQDPVHQLARKTCFDSMFEMQNVLLPLSSEKMFVNNRNTEEDPLQSRRVDEHLYNMYKTLQKFFNIFFFQFLTFFASRFCYVLPNKKKELDWHV